MSTLIMCYIGFGMGMVLRIILDDKVYYISGEERKKLSTFQMFFFIIGCAILWPLRFFNSKVCKCFVLEDRKTKDVMPL